MEAVGIYLDWVSSGSGEGLFPTLKSCLSMRRFRESSKKNSENSHPDLWIRDVLEKELLKLKASGENITQGLGGLSVLSFLSHSDCPVVENIDNIIKLPHASRTKKRQLWEQGENALFICRPSRWGNPFPLNVDGRSRTESLIKYIEYLYREGPHLMMQLNELRGSTI